MLQNLEHCVLRILNAQGRTVGTGFVVGDNLAVTCAHVVQKVGVNCEQFIQLQFYTSENKLTAQVLTEGWSPPESDDVAFLRLDHVPEGVVPVVLGSANRSDGHPYITFGFASLAFYECRKVSDTINGIVKVIDGHKQPMLQVKGEEVDQGLSGSPILDTRTNRVVGMLSEYKDNKFTRLTWATTADTLITHYPALQLWPEAYGPDELHAYLDYLIKDNQTLPIPLLSGGDKLPLERVYVSLRADEMNIAEREAERDLYLEDVIELQNVIGGDLSDPYTRFTELHQAIVRFPQMRMLVTRNRLRLFAELEADSLSLAEIVRQHQYAVLLGNPGSGKTTLGKWLVLQFARAFLGGEAHVRVRADLVRSDAETEEFIDLGPAHLPILVQIADYARARWNEAEVDTKLPLEDFLGQQYNSRKDKPITLTPEAIYALTHAYLKRGRALIVLDGLDEVSNPHQRREVMHAVREFIREQLRVAVEDAEVGNRVFLTSRIVGYQFDPLTELPHYTLENMDGKAIAAFCRNWTSQVMKTDEVGSSELAEHLLDVIFNQSHPSVRTLAENPLLLTILVQMQRMYGQQELPTRRVELFSKAAEALYGQRKSFWRQAEISPEALTRGLSAVAAYIQAYEATGFAEEETVRVQLDATFKDRRQTEALLEAAREGGGVLVAHSEGVYGFIHRSLQEYFAAKFLTEKPEHVAEQIGLRLLNPTWHEPIVLAMGIVSQAGYSANRRRLSESFTCILNAPDPVGDILPRRELLAIEACEECKRIPPEIGRQIAEKLLDLYAGHRGPITLRILQDHILHAFTALHNGDAAVEVEAVLCDAVGARDTRRRLAAVDLILRAQWDSPAIIRALVEAWCAYPDPAASLLTALDDVRDRQPALFQQDFLPLRQALMDEQLLWERIRTDQEWAALIHTLYMSPNSDCAPEQITRDSPLTPQVLAALRQAPETHPLVALQQHLLSLAKRPGTASARDAALGLSALGDLTWVKACVENAEGKEHLIRPLIASLNYMLTRIHALYQDYSRDRSHDPPFKGSRTLATTLARLLGLGCAQNGIPARDLDHSLSYLLDVGCSCSRMCVNHLQRAKVGWRSNTDVMKLFSSEYTVAHTLQSRITTLMPLAHAWTALVEVCLEKWPVQTKLETETGGSDELTADTLANLVVDLTASDDAHRKHARKVLTTERRASELGRTAIELMAALVKTHSNQPSVAAVLELALERITHDVPIWIAEWIMEAGKGESDFSHKQILYRIRRVTPAVFETIFNALQNAGPDTTVALLTSIRLMAKLDQIPKICQRAAGEQLMTWLQQEREPNIRHAIIDALGDWPENRKNVISMLLASLNTPPLNSDLPVLYAALARLAARQPTMVKHVRTILANACDQPEAAAALVRLNVADAKYKSTLKKISACGVPERYLAGKRLLTALSEFSLDKYHLLAALLDAATDNDIWDGDYHGILMNSVGFQVEYHPDLMKMLLTQLQQALSKQEWSRRRTLLAAIAACIEVMPTVVQQTAHKLFLSKERFEELLVQGATDPASQDTRCFALAALSYLRTATGAVIPALLQACQDTEEVQLAAIDAARRFQSIQGNPLPRLVEALTDENISKARVASQLLSSLGRSAAGEIASLREEIIEVLVSALRSLSNRKNAEVVESGRTELEYALYRALLEVAGWQQLAYRV